MDGAVSATKLFSQKGFLNFFTKSILTRLPGSVGKRDVQLVLLVKVWVSGAGSPVLCLGGLLAGFLVLGMGLTGRYHVKCSQVTLSSLPLLVWVPHPWSPPSVLALLSGALVLWFCPQGKFCWSQTWTCKDTAGPISLCNAHVRPHRVSLSLK